MGEPLSQDSASAVLQGSSHDYYAHEGGSQTLKEHCWCLGKESKQEQGACGSFLTINMKIKMNFSKDRQ